VYFNGIFALLAGAVYFATGEEAALFAAAVQHLIMLQQLMPLMRFDGYYVLTDLTGVPDILSRIKPIFRSLVRGRESEPRVAELKPWVRVAVTGYLVTLVPALFLLFVWMVMSAPRILATIHDSFGIQLDRFNNAGGFAEAGVAVVGIVALALPVLGMALSLTRVSRMAGRGLARWSSGSPRRRFGAVVVAGAVIGAVAYAWWPTADYRPIQPGERGVIAEALNALPETFSGRSHTMPDEAAGYLPASGTSERTAIPSDRQAEDRPRSGPEQRVADPTPEPALERPVDARGSERSGAATTGADPSPVTESSAAPGPGEDGSATDATSEPTPTGAAPDPATSSPEPTASPDPTAGSETTTSSETSPDPESTTTE
jgi:putative peptide zinc metalloprotease protein